MSGFNNMTKEITYFISPGSGNTLDTLSLARKRALELGLKCVVVASTTGRTGVLAAEEFSGTGIKVIIVTEHYGYKTEGQWFMKDEHLLRLKELNVQVMTQSHALSGVERSISKKIGGSSRVEAIAEAFRRLFGVGVKVCIEVTIMAADSGFIPAGPGVEVMAIGGMAGGADTAIVVRPAHMSNFFDLEVREIVCMPRSKKMLPGTETSGLE